MAVERVIWPHEKRQPNALTAEQIAASHNLKKRTIGRYTQKLIETMRREHQGV